MKTHLYQIPVNETKLVGILSLTATFFLCAHGLLVTYNYLVSETPWYLLQLFDLNEENNLPTWYSGFNLLVATFFLWITSREKKNKKDKMAKRWTILFLGFAFLSIDEIAGVHESINSVVDATWAYGGAVIVAVLGLYFFPLLKTLPRHTLIGFVIAGAVFVGGSVGMEIIGEPMDSDSLLYNLTTLVEEGMEMFGIILFIKALLKHMGEYGLAVGMK